MCFAGAVKSTLWAIGLFFDSFSCTVEKDRLLSLFIGLLHAIIAYSSGTQDRTRSACTLKIKMYDNKGFYCLLPYTPLLTANVCIPVSRKNSQSCFIIFDRFPKQ